MDQTQAFTKYRMYVDESGTHSYSVADAVSKRYLALVGVVIREDHNRDHLNPLLQNLKSLLTRDPDERITLHRQEIANRQGVYSALMDSALEKRWNKIILEGIADLEFVLFTVVLDKRSHKRRYQRPMHPYHYCFSILLECCVDYLLSHNGVGDVMVEGRGKEEDSQLVQEYKTAYNIGSASYDSVAFRKALTSRHLKIRSKVSGIAGLELADLLALASNLDVLTQNGIIPKVNSHFTKQLIVLLQAKYYSRIHKSVRKEPCRFLIT